MGGYLSAFLLLFEIQYLGKMKS